MARKPKFELTAPKPKGCRLCHGRPFVDGEGGAGRCTCPLGVYYLQADRARTVAARKATATPVEHLEIDFYPAAAEKEGVK